MAGQETSGQTPAEPQTVSRAAFLGGLLVIAGLVALSVIGIGHARTIRGAANPQFWIVTLLVGGAFAAVTVGLAKNPARTAFGETARKIGVVLAAVWLVVFFWETAAVGTGAFTGPLELAWHAYKG